jgi:predicted branched-subunit amino acid permease
MTAAEPPRAAFLRGLRDSVPFMVIVVPFAMVFGVVATDAGLKVAEVMAFSVLVIAGAAQLAAVQLMAENAPTVVVIASALMVNLRMAMYSAALTPHLGRVPVWQRALVAYMLTDQSFAAASAEYETRPQATRAAKAAYYFGIALLVCPVWYGATYVGATAGNALPPGLPLDFALPLTFLAMVAPMMRSLPHLVAILVSTLGALVGSGLPYNLGLIAAAPFAMAAGAATEVWLGRRRVRG